MSNTNTKPAAGARAQQHRPAALKCVHCAGKPGVPEARQYVSITHGFYQYHASGKLAHPECVSPGYAREFDQLFMVQGFKRLEHKPEGKLHGVADRHVSGERFTVDDFTLNGSRYRRCVDFERNTTTWYVR